MTEIISGDVSTEIIDSKGRISDLRSNLGLGEYDDNGRAMVPGTIYKDESQHTQTANKHANLGYKIVIVGEIPPPPGALDFWPEFYARGKGVLEWDVPETKNFLPPPPPSDPLILDLDGDGVELTSLTEGTKFDIDGNGTLDQTSWTKSSNDFDDAFLVLDSNKNGEIDSGTELFGDQKGSANGYIELSKLDSNQDGTIDAKDTAYKDLQLWADMDGDGKVGDGELKGLEELGVKSISTKFTGQVGSKIDANGNDISLESTFTRVVNGEEKTLKTVDAFFVTDAAETNQRTITSTQAGANSVVTTRSTSTNNASISPDEINATSAEDEAELEAEEKTERFRQISLSNKLDEAEANKQAYESELSSVESEVNNATSKSSTVKITKPASSEDEETEAVDVSSSEDDTVVLSRKDSLTADISSIDSEIENLRSQIE
ncbi:MAG: hypothetical protein EBR67_05755 [Proteobacteria bacterium]|nr:hypothetical protein [Pseudomonadota bacterium]